MRPYWRQPFQPRRCFRKLEQRARWSSNETPACKQAGSAVVVDEDIKRAWIPLKSEPRNALFSTANRSRLDAPPSDVRADFATAICDEADLICDAL
ncbi:hypothetical protein BTE77_04315 [Ensifer adhaerens]|nr:hypothetical protein BTE77_04315 [Ensifer adhaerens]